MKKLNATRPWKRPHYCDRFKPAKIAKIAIFFFFFFFFAKIYKICKICKELQKLPCPGLRVSPSRTWISLERSLSPLRCLRTTAEITALTPLTGSQADQRSEAAQRRFSGANQRRRLTHHPERALKARGEDNFPLISEHLSSKTSFSLLCLEAAFPRNLREI